MCFVDALRDDIRAPVSLHRPLDFDTAASLALLQEDVGSNFRTARKHDYSYGSKSVPRGPQPLPPPPRIDKAVSAPVLAEEKKICEGKSPEERMAALRAFRRAKGLCIRCAEKWHCGHKCSPTVQLHAVQELLEVFQLDDIDHLYATSEHMDQLFVALSKEAISGQDGPRTMRLHGIIQGHPLLILVDSGSTHTFISQALSSSLQETSQMFTDNQVQVANGSILHCNSVLKAAKWSVDDFSFTSDLKVLPLCHFDMILGMDWLEEFSPMQVHWKSKWMAIPYNGSTAILQGITPSIPDEVLVHVCNVIQSDAPPGGSPVLPGVSLLLEEFVVVFEPLSQLPPERSCDHTIPLIPGAKPVYIRPYRYPPSLKDEIEKQVAEMLDKGIIKPSTSAFSSPVLLVRKKDGTWRFCIDYRYLNALTLKSKFPIPVFDELMDELAKAQWFSTLDLNSGYHQIRLKLGEEYKTAFQTHFGLFEFNVMAFGLCGAPATFQGALNTTLAPLLRKCVLVFFDDILVYSATLTDHLEHLRQVLQLLANDQWQVKLSKCTFAQQQLAYLGHIISAAGVATDPSKVHAIQSWPQPTNVKELRSFLGLAGYYRKFVRHFAVIAKH
jgi:hypothetical protein